jgi:hypothetical protein
MWTFALRCLAPYNTKISGCGNYWMEISRNFKIEEKTKTFWKQKMNKYCTSIKMFGFEIILYVS